MGLREDEMKTKGYVMVVSRKESARREGCLFSS